MSLFNRKNRDPTVKRSSVMIQSGWDPIITGYRPAAQNEDVQKCVNIIADLVSSMTLMLMENGEHGDIRVKNGLSKRMDIYPSSTMNRKTLIFNIVRDMLETGNKVCLVKTSGNDDYLDEIVPVPSASVSFVDQSLTDYRILIGGRKYKRDEVLHFVLNPRRDYQYIGRGMVDAVIDCVKSLDQANATKNAFQTSEWKPSMIISVPADSEKLMTKEGRAKILGSYTETTKEGEPWVIPSGEIDVKTITPLTLNDLAIQDGIELDKKTLAAGFRIPPFMLGVGSYNKDEYNNFVSTVIMGIAQTIEQELTRGTLYAPNLYWKFKKRSLMDYSITELTAFVQGMKDHGMMTGNEGRNEFDLSPLDIKELDEIQVLENYIPVSDVGNQNKLGGGDENGNATQK